MLLSILKISSSKISSDGSHYYFSRLTDEQKIIYESLLSGMSRVAKEIKIPIRPINEILKVFNYVLFDNPMIFYVSSFKHTSDLYRKKCSIVPLYTHAQHIIKEYTSAVENYFLVFDTIKMKSDIEKEIFVHDHCLNNFSYDYTFGDYSYSVLGPVLNKSAVSEGFAKFVKLALDYLGIKSLVVSGKAKNPNQGSGMEGYVWNIVKINGKTYHLDVTANMMQKTKVNRYDYFNLSDHDIKKDHIIIADVPACSTEGNDFYSLNSLLVNNIADLDNYIGKALKQNKKNILVKIMDTQYTDNIVKKVIGIAQQQYNMICNGNAVIEVRYNSSQMVFEINFK